MKKGLLIILAMLGYWAALIGAVALVNSFRRKATVMREIERSAADYLDRYDRREGHK